MKKNTIQPLTILVVTISLLILFSIFAVIEFNQSRQGILSLMDQKGLVLLNALMAGAERSILAYEALEHQMQQRLYQAARAIDALELHTELTRPLLNQMAERMDVYRIHLFDPGGERVLSNTSPHPEPVETHRPGDYRSRIADVLSGAAETQWIGFREGGYNQPRYAVALARSRGGAIVVTADAEALHELRREVGPGRFIQEIGDRTGVSYVVLQDTLGIRMASRGVKTLGAIQPDLFLNHLLRNRAEGSRITTYEGRNLFEIASAFFVGETPMGLFRIGLDAKAYMDLMRTSKIRLVLVAVSLLLVGVIGFSLFTAHQNARLWNASYRQIETHTGEILQHLEDAVLAVDAGGRVTVCNAAAGILFAITRDAMLGRPLRPGHGRCFRHLLETLETGREIRHRESVCRIGGREKIVLISTSCVRNETGVIIAGILVATDLTVQRRLESELRRREQLQAMGALASGVAHEVRNPINAIGMIAQRLKKEFEPVAHAEAYQKLSDAMIQEVYRINAIIQQFLQFSKPPQIRPRPAQVRPLVESIVTIFKSSAETEGVRFFSAIHEDATLMLDADQMKQALLNLLKNGLEACLEGDQLTLTAGLEKPFYRIGIQDTGKGISEADQERIFDLYFTTKAEGTGIGLPIVSRIVQAHQGTIEVRSRENEGTTVTLRLPLADG